MSTDCDKHPRALGSRTDVPPPAGHEIGDPSDQPFPLRRYFYFAILPGLLLLIGAVVYATTAAVRSGATEVMLQLATTKVEGIARGIETAAPVPWRKLLAGNALSDQDLAELGQAFASEQREAQISLLKLYGRDRKTLYATEADEIGKIEDKPALREALTLGRPSVLVEQDVKGSTFYELYLPYRFDGNVAVVFELYEPIANFDALLWRVVRPALIVPLALFCLMLGLLAWLVGRGQADIDARTGAIVSLRQRIERLVSRRAVAAMRSADTAGERTELIDVTLLYSDVRGFTPFAETRAPHEVIAFLNRIIGLQVGIIEAREGDIDKMIGDAVLARFHGSDRARQAVDSAIAIHRAVMAAGLPLGVGIGLFSGPAVAGLIGAGDRLDYTVVGDSVNTVARLCGLAKAGEIIADSATVAASGIAGFADEDTMRVKGRTEELAVRRLKLRDPKA